MIKHVVAFKFTGNTEEQRRAHGAEFLRQMNTLIGVVPGLLAVQVGWDLRVHEGHWDAVLVSEHRSNNDLEAYRRHPAHIQVAQWVESVMLDRAVVDFDDAVLV